MTYDDIYKEPRKITNFTFNEEVVNVFENMIGRSVPGYNTIVQMSAVIAHRYAKSQTKIYDLGCSLGAVSKAIREKNDLHIVAVDSSQEMIVRCRQKLRNLPAIEIVCEDVCDTNINNASVVILNFTMQFVPREKRNALLQKIYNGLCKDGVLLLSEKINHTPKKNNDLQRDLHHNFKKDQGYSELEIDQKKRALQEVMLLDSIEDHQQRLANIGFKHNEIWFQCFNFVSFFCQKC